MLNNNNSLSSNKTNKKSFNNDRVIKSKLKSINENKNSNPQIVKPLNLQKLKKNNNDKSLGRAMTSP